MLASEHIT